MVGSPPGFPEGFVPSALCLPIGEGVAPLSVASETVIALGGGAWAQEHRSLPSVSGFTGRGGAQAGAQVRVRDRCS